MILWRCWVW